MLINTLFIVKNLSAITLRTIYRTNFCSRCSLFFLLKYICFLINKKIKIIIHLYFHCDILFKKVFLYLNFFLKRA